MMTDAPRPTAADLHQSRRARVAVQVASRWQGDDYDDQAFATAINAAELTFTPMINDLDWERATLALLGEG